MPYLKVIVLARVVSLTSIPGVEAVFAGPRFHEAVIRLPKRVGPVLEALSKRDIFGGFDLSRHYPELGNAVLVCVTDTKTDTDIDTYRSALADALAA